MISQRKPKSNRLFKKLHTQLSRLRFVKMIIHDILSPKLDMTIREGDYAQAVYAFESESPSDLSLKVKDVVKVTEVINDSWARGQRVHPEAEGIFPLAFVSRLHLPSVRTGQRVFLACQDFEAEQNGDLELAKGDIIVGTEAIDDSWWNGKNGPLKGMFPLSFVVELQEKDSVRSRAASGRSNSFISRSNSVASSSDAGYATLDNPVIAQALVNVTPQLHGELAFQMGDLIEITAFVDSDWMYGRCREKEGLVSAVCVELLEDSSDTPVCGGTMPTTASSVYNTIEECENMLKNIEIRGDASSHPASSLDKKQTKSGSCSSSNEQHHPRTNTEGSYTSENTRSHDAEITPYARVVYPFTAQYSSEVSLKENQIVSLIQHLNPDWTEGEVDGKRGMFPSSFIEIIVDCPYCYNCDNDDASTKARSSSGESGSMSQSSVELSSYNAKISDVEDCNLKNNSVKCGSVLEKQRAVEEEEVGVIDGRRSVSSSGISVGISDVLIISEGHEIGLALHDFQAQVEGDVSVREGDTLEVIERVDDNWIRVKLDTGERGLVPTNHIEIIGHWPKEEQAGDGRAQNSVEDSVGKYNEKTTSIDESSVDQPRVASVSKIVSKPNNEPDSKSLAGQGNIVTNDKPSSEAMPSKLNPTPVTKPAPSSNTKLAPKPKPAIAPKPTIAPKPSVITTTTTNNKPFPKQFNKPLAALYTAKPFSAPSSSNTTFSSGAVATTTPTTNLPPHRVPKLLFQQQKQHTLPSSLDNIIEGEITKAKGSSRSSSQNSASSNDSIQQSPATANLDSDIPVSTSTTVPHAQVLTATPSVTNRRASAPSPTNKDVSKFDPFKPLVPAPIAKSGRPPLISSVSLPSEQLPATVTSAITTADSKKSVFINAAYEHDIDEGILIPNLSTTALNPPNRPPPRIAPTSRPLQVIASAFPSSSSSSVPPTTTVTQSIPSLPSKLKAPPPRPTGPRLASAPPKTLLVPTRVAPQAPGSRKPVPSRPAPTLPGGTNVGVASLLGTVINNDISQTMEHSHVDPSKSENAQRPVQSLRRPPPRPSAFPSPPKRPPPMSTDLIKFSPESATQVSDEEEEEEEELDEEKKELVKDLKTRIAEAVADIKKYEITKAELQQRLQELHKEEENEDEEKKEEEEEDVKEKLVFVENTLTGLKGDRDELIENLFRLSPKEGRTEKSQLLAAQNAEEEQRRKEEEAQREAELKARRRNQRSKVIQEILDTEKDYLFSLQLCQETFLDGSMPPPSSVDLEFLLGNMEEITDVSLKVLANLEAGVSGRAFEDQKIGNCFTFYYEDMKNTYAPYCRNHDSVISNMEKYLENEEISEYLNRVVEKMREQMNVFDLAGVLIKPVQRILKYPLLLNELLKNTEDSHVDKMELLLAIKAMTDVAKAINEYKRQKDLVYKYKKKGVDQTFGDKLAKLNLHSLKKKSSRMRGRLSTNLGMGLQLKDETFEKEEAKFQSLEKAVKVFLTSTNKYMEQSQETMRCQECLLDDIEMFYHGNECEEATRFRDVNNKLRDLYVTMRKTIEDVVIVPLNKLVALFEAPSKVIQKRFDKMLDYNYQLGKGIDSYDKDVEAAKNDYEAMNAQLLDELPKFYNLAMGILNKCMSAFVTARRDFMDQSLKESCVLLELPSMSSKDNMMATFNIRHTTAFDHMCMLSFIPRGFNPRVDTVKADKSRQRTKNGSIATDGSPQQLLQTSPGSQSDSQKAYLHQQYAPEKLFTVTTTHNAIDVMDISLTEGMLVGVFKELDPMGNKDRWFVDDGAAKGFAPRNVLCPVSSISSRVEEDVLSIHSYDSGGGNDSVPVISGQEGKRMSTYSTHSLDSTGGGYSNPVQNQMYPQLQQQQQNYGSNKRDSSSSLSTSPLTSSNQHQYYYALYDFQARHTNEATLVAGNYVSVLDFQDAEGNPEWWLVHSESGQGYAPANYLAPMPYDN